MKKKCMRVLYCLFAVSLLGAVDAADILGKADAMFKQKNFYQVSRMNIRKKGRDQPRQIMETYYSELNGESHTLTVFREPKRIKGTAYLTIEDNLWVRFSSTGRVRKLSSSARKNSASGSDFSYSDMGSGGDGYAEKYSSVLLGEETLEGRPCYKIELKPLKKKKDLYEKLIVYISREDSLYRKAEIWDKGAHIKTMIFEDYRITGSFSYPWKISMESLARNSKSVIEVTEMELDSSRVNKNLFTQGYLKNLK